MNGIVPVLKDETAQQPVPTVWRESIFLVVKAFAEGDYRLDRRISGVAPIPQQKAEQIARNVKGYGATLTELPEESWNSSVCQWMKGYWEVLVDLFTVEEGRSDLVLSVHVVESDSSFRFEVQSVYVP
jgi:hypothetical protein